MANLLLNVKDEMEFGCVEDVAWLGTSSRRGGPVLPSAAPLPAVAHLMLTPFVTKDAEGRMVASDQATPHPSHISLGFPGDLSEAVHIVGDLIRCPQEGS